MNVLRPPLLGALWVLSLGIGCVQRPTPMTQDAGSTSPGDAGTLQQAPDGGATDAGSDGGSADAGSDGGTADAGSTGGTAVRTIAITPTPEALNNPTTAAATTPGQPVSLAITAFDASGAAITGAFASPIVLTAYGPPGVLSPMSATLSAASDSPVVLTYAGTFFSSPLTLTATSGTASATAQLLPANLVQCSAYDALDGSISIPQASTDNPVANGWFLDVSIAGGASSRVQVDTGSVGFIVSATAIGPDAIGPGAPGRQEYTSDGLILTGNYWLAPVTLNVGTPNGGQTTTTVPMEVLGITSVTCDPAYPSCTPPADASGIGVLGIGFDRGTPGEPLAPPDMLGNAFLQASSVVTGTMRPGYTITADAVTVGLAATDIMRFKTVEIALTRATDEPGDWAMMPGCFTFDEVTGGGPFCGQVLVDTGISSMILALPTAQRPASVTPTIPAGTDISVGVPNATDPLFAYSFTTSATTNSNPLAPSSERWATGSSPFVNTGRHVLARYDYLYDPGCGAVGLLFR